MRASIQWCACGCGRMGVIRVHPAPEGDWRRRDGYTWSCSFDRDGAVAELLGVTIAPTLDEARAVVAALRREGMTGRRALRVRRPGDAGTPPDR